MQRRVQLTTRSRFSVLQATSTPQKVRTVLKVMREEIEATVKSLECVKAPGVDNIVSEQVKQGGEETRPEQLYADGFENKRVQNIGPCPW